jgi:hypothetical protein
MISRSFISRSGSEWTSHDHNLVIDENRLRARVVSARIKNSLDGILIDPTAVPDLGRWNQDDYRFTWGEIIKEYAERLYFVQSGILAMECAYEFLIAKKHKKETFDENLQDLSLGEGSGLIREAIKN